MQTSQTLPSHQLSLATYEPFPYAIQKDDKGYGVHLDFKLKLTATDVTSTVRYARTMGLPEKTPFVLHGSPEMKLLSIEIDGHQVDPKAYTHHSRDGSLTLHHPPKVFTLKLRTQINPKKNGSAKGLYISQTQNGHILCTQCEPDGFRKLTFYPDRPDVMTTYRVSITGKKSKYPLLLSNGNLVDSKILPGGMHKAVWEDPHNKPSYLFALVAGDLNTLEDAETTKEDRTVTLQVMTEHRYADRTGHAMESLKRAMKWDEDTFGLCYDLDLYMIVAVSSFNAGAMENKGLNLFNTKYVLANAQTATDNVYRAIEGVIAHEYFHNWTGNRITCKDWLQLSLKEGLTVYRDQEFTRDMHGRDIGRIDNVAVLRAAQFPQDSGPTSHPVRPAKADSVENLYTSTVYNKGAEVVRMYETLLGKDGFRKGMDLYFKRHDGEAVTCEDFARAMFDANLAELDVREQECFLRWYNTHGTPLLRFNFNYDEDAHTFTITARQSIPNNPDAQNMLMPIRLGILGPDGKDLPLVTDDDVSWDAKRNIWRVLEGEQDITFQNIPKGSIPSLLRGFSAPVNIEAPYTMEQLAFMMAHDSDGFNRWDASQKLCTIVLFHMTTAAANGSKAPFNNVLYDAWATILNAAMRSEIDPALAAQILTPPAQSTFAEQYDVIPLDAMETAYRTFRHEMGKSMLGGLSQAFKRMRTPKKESGGYVWTDEQAGKRALANVCLKYLAATLEPTALKEVVSHYHEADNMTDSLAPLELLLEYTHTEAQEALEAFETLFGDDPEVMLLWFQMQASCQKEGGLERVKALLNHPMYREKAGNPNFIRSVYGSFMTSGAKNFHNPDGSGYDLIAALVKSLQKENGGLAAKLTESAFSKWKRYDTTRQAAMKTALWRVKETPDLHKDVEDMVNRMLGDEIPSKSNEEEADNAAA